MIDPGEYTITQPAFQQRYGKSKDLGKGGMGVVWLVEDRKYNRKVAMKILKPNTSKLSASELYEFRQRFVREAQVVAQLNHPNIVQIYEYGICNTIHFFTMEYLEGSDLRRSLLQSRLNDKFSVEEFLILYYHLCDAIEWAHRKNVIHRDLKPANVLLGKNGKLVVCDWGISKIIEGDIGSTSAVTEESGLKTADNVLVGTPSYLSPEQVCGKKIDKRTDIYQLGAILYEAMTGNPPFENTVEDVERRQHTKDFSFEIPKSIDSALQNIIALALAKEKKDRYQTVTALKKDLKQHIDALFNLEKYVAPEGTVVSKLFRRHERKKKEVFFLPDIVRSWAVIK